MKIKSLAAFVLTLTTIGLTLPTVARVPGLSPFPQNPQLAPSSPPIEFSQTPRSSSPANISQQSSSQSRLAANTTDPFIVLVNGSGDCCAYLMKAELQRKLNQSRRTTEIWTTSYAQFKDGSTTNQFPDGISTDEDTKFIKKAPEILNNIPASRPIVLIGHSYGGDSILKILPLITRQIQLVVVIDPVGTAGSRAAAIINTEVPTNVEYFMNRWQENGLTGTNIVPFDSRMSGDISCRAKVCDQEAQNLARQTDGAPTKVSCGAQEVTCPGWTPIKCSWKGCRKGSNGTKSKRMFHNDMPMDEYIQRIVGDRLMTQIAMPPQSNPVEVKNPVPVKNPVLAGYEDPTRKVIIESLYILILQRDVDPSEMTTWLNALASGQSVDEVRRAIAESPEAQNKLNDLYRKMLCRDIDPSGKTTWTDALATTWTFREVADNGIALSAEYQSRGGKSCN